MAVIDDIMDQATLTDRSLVRSRRRWRLLPFLGEQIAPMQDTDSQYVSACVSKTTMRSASASSVRRKPHIPLMDITGSRGARGGHRAGLPGRSAPHLSAPLGDPHTQGGDTLAGREAGKLIEIGQILERRNERLTEWMRWQAFSGQLTIEYQQRDTALVIDYPLPTGPQAGRGDPVDGHHEQRSRSTI
jgi:hypothetical protein